MAGYILSNATYASEAPRLPRSQPAWTRFSGLYWKSRAPTWLGTRFIALRPRFARSGFPRTLTFMVLIFDLDDTLYEELTYVSSGFRAVARWLETQFQWDQESSYQCMWEILERQGRGKSFDRVLQRNGKLTAALVRACVSVYRHHQPNIQLL